ncbi:MAG: tetratricopeptide repeat protein [Desulfosoma sp.]
MKPITRTAPSSRLLAWSVPTTLVFFVLAFLTTCASRPEDRARELDRRAKTAWAEHRFAVALALWEEAYGLTPDDTTLALRLAQAYGYRSQWDKGLELCRHVLDRDSRHLKAWRTLALLAMASGHMDQALRAVETLKHLDPKSAASRSLNGDFLLLQGNAKGALQSYEAALDFLRSEETSSEPLAEKETLPGLTDPDAKGVLQAKKAACLIALGRRTEALHLVGNLAAGASKDSQLWAHLGRLWEILGEKDQAIRAYEAAYDLNPGDLSPMVHRIRLALDDHRPQEATEALDRLEKDGASTEVVGKLRLEVALREGQLQEAARVLAKLKAKGVVDTEVRLLEAKIRLLEDRPLEALLILEKLLDLEPHIPTTHYLAGLAHLRLNHIRLAQKSMIRALELNPGFTEARLVLAAGYYKLNETEPARAHAEALAAREPENPEARILLALCAAEKGFGDEAARHVQALRLLNGDPLRTFSVQTQVLAHAGETKRALKTAFSLWESFPLDADAAWLAVRLSCQTGRSDEAQKLLEQIRDRGASSSVFQVLTGDLALCLNRKEEARKAYARALELDGRAASAYRGLVRSEEASEETLRRILEDFRKQVPSSVEPVTALADLAFQKGDMATARSLLERDLSAHPDSAILLNNLAWVYLESDQCLDKALSLAQRAYDLLPHRVEVLDTLGYAYLKKGLSARALWYLSEARSRDPQNPMPAYHLGLLYAHQNDNDQARLHLEAALRLGLPADAAAHASSLLQNLSSSPRLDTSLSESVPPSNPLTSK